MKRNRVWKYAFGAAVMMMLAPAVSKAQNSQGLNLMITGNKESGFQFVQTTDTFYNGKGDKIVMAYTRPCTPGRDLGGQAEQPCPTCPPENNAQKSDDNQVPSYQKAKKKITEDIPQTPLVEQKESTAVKNVQIPPVEIPPATEVSASAGDRSDGTCHDTEEYDPTRLRRIDDVKYPEEDNEEADDADYGERHFFGNVNTNALYDVMLVPNIGAEIAFSKDYSAGFNAWITWIRNSQTDHWRQNYGADIYGRYWFGEDHDARDFLGWHTGLYIGAMSYDIWTKGKGYQSPNMFNTMRFGADLGYSMRLGDNWRVDFNGGLGLLHTKQKVYNSNFGGGYYISKQRNRNLLDLMRWGITFNYILK